MAPCQLASPGSLQKTAGACWLGKAAAAVHGPDRARVACWLIAAAGQVPRSPGTRWHRPSDLASRTSRPPCRAMLPSAHVSACRCAAITVLLGAGLLLLLSHGRLQPAGSLASRVDVHCSLPAQQLRLLMLHHAGAFCRRTSPAGTWSLSAPCAGLQALRAPREHLSRSHAAALRCWPPSGQTHLVRETREAGIAAPQLYQAGACPGIMNICARQADEQARAGRQHSWDWPGQAMVRSASWHGARQCSRRRRTCSGTSGWTRDAPDTSKFCCAGACQGMRSAPCAPTSASSVALEASCLLSGCHVEHPETSALPGSRCHLACPLHSPGSWE